MVQTRIFDDENARHTKPLTEEKPLNFTRAATLAIAELLLTRGVAAAPEDVAPTDAPAHELEAEPNPPSKTEAEERRRRALGFYDAGNFSAARAEFLRANQLMPSFRLLYNLGVVSMALGDSASAYDYFELYLDNGGAAVPANTRSDVELQLRDLAEHIATLVVTVDQAGAEVFVDESALGLAPISRPLHVNAGMRRVWARLGDTRTDSRIVELAGGVSARVDLKLGIPAPKPLPARAIVPSTQVFWAGWVGTAALAGGATVAGLEALAAQRSYREKYDRLTTRAELDQANARATGWSIAADTLGGAAITLFIYSTYVTLRHRRPQPSGARSSQKFAVQLSTQQAHFSFAF